MKVRKVPNLYLCLKQAYDEGFLRGKTVSVREKKTTNKKFILKIKAYDEQTQCRQQKEIAKTCIFYLFRGNVEVAPIKQEQTTMKKRTFREKEIWKIKIYK